MSTTRAGRGRPKGSGIDDRRSLDAIARLIALNPAMRPTTAIRSLGISDPSVIRRLRDKFSSVRTDLMSELQATPRSPASAKAHAALATRAPATLNKTGEMPSANESKRERARSMAASSGRSPTRVGKSAAAETLPSRATKAAPRSPRSPSRSASAATNTQVVADDDSHSRRPGTSLASETQGLITTLMSTGIAATNSFLAAQASFSAQLVQLPVVTMALRQQLAFNEWAVGLMPSFHYPPKSLN